MTQAVILVGGAGTRLRPLTDTRPKPMMPLVDRPFVAHQLDLLRRHGVTDVIFSCGYRPDALVPICQTFVNAMALAVKAESPIKTVADLVKAAQASSAGSASK